MNIMQKLAKAAEVNHGLDIQPIQVKELVTVLQGMQVQIGSDTGRLDALTRILAVTMNQLGGSLDIEPDLFAEAEKYNINVQWDEEDEGAVIHVTLARTEVEVSEVLEDGEATSGGGSNLMPVPESEDRRDVYPDDLDPNDED